MIFGIYLWIFNDVWSSLFRDENLEEFFFFLCCVKKDIDGNLCFLVEDNFLG